MNTLAAISSILLATAVKATFVFLLAWCAALLLKRLSAATRHLLLVFAVAAALLLPFSTFLPDWHVPGIPDLIPQSASQVNASAAVPQSAIPASEPVSVLPLPNIPSPEHAKPVAPSRANRNNSLRKADRPSVATTTISQNPAVSPAETVMQRRTKAVPWAILLALLWMLGTIMFLARLMTSRSRVRWLVRRALLIADSGWNAQVRAIAAAMGITRHVGLLVSADTGIPLTTGILYPVVVLPPDHGEWSPLRREAVLRHELAHIKRLDAFTHLLADFAAGLYWWNPLVWLIARSMRAYRERACDDTVLASGTKASDYAHELLDIVSSLHQPELRSALAMARRSQLEGRILAVLNPGLRRGSVSRATAGLVGGLTLAVVLPLAAMRPAQQATTPATPSQRSSQTKPSPAPTAPAAAAAAQPSTTSSKNDEETVGAPEPPEPPEPAEAAEAAEAPEAPSVPSAFATQSTPVAPAAPAAPAAPSAPSAPAAPAAPAAPSGPGAMDLGPCGRVQVHHMMINEDDGRRTWKASWSGDNCDLSLHAEGDIRFNADASAIESISSGGYFEVNERLNDTLKQIRVTPGASGLEYVYKINGKQQPFDAAARQWLAGLLLELERTTGFNADARVAQLMAKGGPNAVLDEINNLQSDYVRSIYFRKLLEQPNLPAPVILRIINQAAQQIQGDYELARVLMAVASKYELPDETSRTAFLKAAGKLKSDYEHSRVLIELLKRPNISPANVEMALNSAAAMKSDYEKSRVALALIGENSFSAKDVPNYLKLVSSIHSDYEKSRDLIAVLQRYQLPPAAANQIMEAAANMGADYEKSRLLTSLSAKGKFDESQMTNYLKVVDSMKADYERSRSLIALMQNNTLSPASVNRVMENVSHMSADYEKSRVLLTLMEGNKFSEADMTNFLNVVDSMKADYERSRCLTSLLSRNKLSDVSLGRVIDAVPRIGNDYEKARVLTGVAQAYHLEGPLRDRYIKAADSIHSDYDRDRVLAAVVHRASL
jgi:beta-lactamase regulating signal transducer with metallopeptidase domain